MAVAPCAVTKVQPLGLLLTQPSMVIERCRYQDRGGSSGTVQPAEYTSTKMMRSFRLNRESGLLEPVKTRLLPHSAIGHDWHLWFFRTYTGSSKDRVHGWVVNNPKCREWTKKILENNPDTARKPGFVQRIAKRSEHPCEQNNPWVAPPESL